MERELFAMFQQSGSGITKGFIKRLYDIVAPTALKFKIQVKKNPEAKELIEAIKVKMAGLGYNDLELLESLKMEDFREIVVSLNFPEDKLEAWKKDVENWYDLTLKAFQDHYERRMKAWSYVLSLFVVLCLNANIFEIHKEFSSNKVLRDSAVKLAEHFTSIPKDSLIIVSKNGSKDSYVYKSDTLSEQAIERQIVRIDSLVNNKSFQIMRWNTPSGDPMRYKMLFGMQILPSRKDIATATEHNFYGWLVMTLLVGLGAPFWYDTLKSVLGIKELIKSKL